MNTLESIQDSTILPITNLSSQNEEKSTVQWISETGIRIVKVGLNVLDYIPHEQTKCLAILARLLGTLLYIGFAVCQYGYNKFYVKDKDASKVFNDKFFIAGNHFLRLAASVILYNKILQKNPPFNQLAFQSSFFIAYDLYTAIDKEQKFFNFYA